LTFILDTHLLLWVLANPSRLPVAAGRLIAAPDVVTVSSTVAIWEIAIKYRLRKGSPGDMPIPGQQAATLCELAGITLLPILPSDAAAVDDLPPIHADPFDRLLVAQAMASDFVLLTSDRVLGKYGAAVRVV
jgi:PIN domain nuclease of toxin-antitoxin system